MGALLDIKNLNISVRSGGSELRAVRDVSLSVKPGEVLAIVGESGSGKSLTALSIIGLLSKGVTQITSGQILFDGQDLANAPPRLLDRFRGSDIGMIFQEPLSALNPVLKIGEQIIEGLIARNAVSRTEARTLALTALQDVRLSDPERRLDQYPHELSGGMRQRVMIALALISSPKLLIADEPTTALDVTVQAQILDLLADLVAEMDMGLILISHDLGVIAETADETLVIYAGVPLEFGTSRVLFQKPLHPYTRGLLSSMPGGRGGRRARGVRLPTIAGVVPEPGRRPPGCRFAGRCPYEVAACNAALPDWHRLEGSQPARCIRLKELP